MQPLNINTVILRSLISFGIVASSLYTINVLPASAQSSVDERIECIKKFRNYYFSREGGDLSGSDALAKAEQTCAEESNNNRLNLQPQPPLILIPNTGVNQNSMFNQNPISGGSPQAITDCMKRLMYERKLVCTRTGFPGCSHFPTEGFAGWETQDVRTEVSEAAAVQVCQNAR